MGYLRNVLLAIFKKFSPPHIWRPFCIFEFLSKMEKHKFASISLTVKNRVISLKFLTHTISKKCTLGNFQKIFLFPKMAAILNFRIFAKNRKTEICFYLLNCARYSDFVKIFDPTNAKRHEAEIIYMYTNKYLSIIDILSPAWLAGGRL